MFLSQRDDRARMPVALLSGFLGSGKTTLVNALLRDPRMTNTAVAVNEFGEVPIDRDLIDHGADRTVVLANGCLCCNLSGDLDQAVMRLFSRRENGQIPEFARLIIEPSGLADPAPIAQAILRNPVLSRALRLEAIVTTVDCLFGSAQLARHPETRKQVSLADHLVLTKSDLCDEASVAGLRTVLRGLNPNAPIHVAPMGEVDPSVLFPPHFFDPSQHAPPNRSALFADDAAAYHLSGVASVSLCSDRPLRWRAFESWLRGIRIGHADDLLRVKGILNIDPLEGPIVIQGVHHVINAPVALDAWPGPDRRSHLVIIADPATIEVVRTSWISALPGLISPNAALKTG
jgi:G3E family GTPase